MAQALKQSDGITAIASLVGENKKMSNVAKFGACYFKTRLLSFTRMYRRLVLA